MSAKVFDVTGWNLVNIEGYWRFVCHSERLVTSGFMSKEACLRNVNGFRDDEGTRALMSKRYADFYG